MKIANKEVVLLDVALGNLSETTGWKGSWKATPDMGLDGFLELEKAGKQLKFACEVKSVFYVAHLPALLQIKEVQGAVLAIGGRISQAMKERFTEVGINYLESGGNARIEAEGIFILVEGKKGGVTQKRKQLFTNAAIQLVFQLILEPHLLKDNYRQIAAATGASLDNISKTIRKLKAEGHLVELRKGEYAFTNKNALFERWIPEYGERLKPKLQMGRFRLLKDDRWQDMEFDPVQTQWGGEPAADKLAGQIKPVKFTVYTTENKQDLIRKYRLVPDANGEVTVYAAFWDMERHPATTVPLHLVYADLMLSGSPRNFEVAKNLLNATEEPFI